MKQPEIYKLEGEKRDLGKKSVAQLRDDLKVPAVLYGPKVEENVHFSISEVDIEKILSSSETKLQELTVDGTTYKTLLKNVEFDPVTDRVLHADFYVLDESQRVKLKIPIRLTGTAIGVRDGGGRVFQTMRIVRVKVMPDKIPAEFELDITDLGIGDSLHVSELDMEGIDPLDDPRRTIVTIAPPKSEALFTTSIEPDEEELLEGEEAEELAEGEEAPEGEEAAEGEEGKESKEE
ncbi:50S ribosomal protein L25 [Rhodohalobacter barkolensis]|uniref:Large ribosomal subunit protein bL25 n=1 Tax=Rhodohalobacter barkolensis TaxID=2053187 RepID=A0A2N0VHF7_9BACT|nr:50S ribosomal protein L25 [Rhodohalobacter barkolensis]PKD43625.1 50S ribosomal protein L25 [Rhodohalobacter barkolensis]